MNFFVILTNFLDKSSFQDRIFVQPILCKLQFMNEVFLVNPQNFNATKLSAYMIGNTKNVTHIYSYVA